MPFRATLEDVKKSIRQVDVPGAQAMLREPGAIALDVREPDETGQGTVPDALVIPRGFLEFRAEQQIPDPAAPIVVYCASGGRSALAAKTLQDMGYTNVASLQGGFDAWKQSGSDWTVPRVLSSEQQQRYSRHLKIPEVGERGQFALLDARVLIIGAGGLGSPAALYLAAAGVGTIGIVDDDVVDASNLQRQVLHSMERLGTSKAESAKAEIEARNPDVRVVLHTDRLGPTNVESIIADYDLVVDGSDNFSTRYVLNDACVLARKPYVHGSIFRFDGQVTTIDPREETSPCYRCLFPEPPPPELAPNCAEAGVLGVLPGIIGTLQTAEALKLILGIGTPLVGQLLMVDVLEMTFRTLKVQKDPDCPICGPNAPTSLEGIEYTDASCAIPQPAIAD